MEYINNPEYLLYNSAKRRQSLNFQTYDHLKKFLYLVTTSILDGRSSCQKENTLEPCIQICLKMTQFFQKYSFIRFFESEDRPNFHN